MQHIFNWNSFFRYFFDYQKIFIAKSIPFLFGADFFAGDTLASCKGFLTWPVSRLRVSEPFENGDAKPNRWNVYHALNKPVFCPISEEQLSSFDFVYRKLWLKLFLKVALFSCRSEIWSQIILLSSLFLDNIPLEKFTKDDLCQLFLLTIAVIANYNYSKCQLYLWGFHHGSS